MKLYTIGYGGRKPQQFVDLLKAKGIVAVADVRLRPDRSSMGIFAKARTPDKGIQRLLSKAGIRYFSFPELGNIFLHLPDWSERYAGLIQRAGDLLTERLKEVPQPFCLMCAEKDPDRCHRSIIAEYLARKGYEVEHIE